MCFTLFALGDGDGGDGGGDGGISLSYSSVHDCTLADNNLKTLHPSRRLKLSVTLLITLLLLTLLTAFDCT